MMARVRTDVLRPSAWCLGRLWRMNPFGASASNVKPPEKGSFPLDRQGKCKEHATKFLACIQEHQRDYGACKELSKAYLQCRMDQGLMQQEDLSKLGFREAEPEAQHRKRAERTREKEGFVAGTGVKTVFVWDGRSFALRIASRIQGACEAPQATVGHIEAVLRIRRFPFFVEHIS